jgi:hypothetical protein
MFDGVKARMLKRKREELKTAPASKRDGLMKDIERLKRMKKDDIGPIKKIKPPSLEQRDAPLKPPHNVAKRKTKKKRRG